MFSWGPCAPFPKYLQKIPFNYTLVHTLSQTNLACWTCHGKNRNIFHVKSKPVFYYFQRRRWNCGWQPRLAALGAGRRLASRRWYCPCVGPDKMPSDRWLRITRRLCRGRLQMPSVTCLRAGMCVCVESEVKWRRGEGGGGSVSDGNTWRDSPRWHTGMLIFTSELTCWDLESSVCARARVWVCLPQNTLQGPIMEQHLDVNLSPQTAVKKKNSHTYILLMSTGKKRKKKTLTFLAVCLQPCIQLISSLRGWKWTSVCGHGRERSASGAGNIPQKLNSNFGLKNWPKHQMYLNTILYTFPRRKWLVIVKTGHHYSH